MATTRSMNATDTNDAPHVLDRGADGWMIKHPLGCRPKLFDCPVNVAAERQLMQPKADEVGRFAVTLDGDGNLVIGGRVDDAAPIRPDDVFVHHGDTFARWGQAPAVAPGEPIDPVPAVYSWPDGIELGDLRLDFPAATVLIDRLLAAIDYERSRAPEPTPLIAIDADCPKCGYPERNLNPVTGVFGCRRCPYTSKERNA